MKNRGKWLWMAGILCVTIAGCGKEDVLPENAETWQSSETASESKEKGKIPEKTDIEGRATPLLSQAPRHRTQPW